MKRFIKDITYVLLLGVIFITGIESLQFLIPNTYTYKKNYVEQHKNGISVLLLGHSHMLRGVNPHILGDSVFNFAESGRWIYYDAKIVERYVPSMQNLHVIVYPIGYDMPMGYLSCHYEHDHPEYKDNHDYNIHMYAKYLNIPYDRVPLKYTSYSSFLSGFLALEEFTKKKLECDSLGFEVQDSIIHWPEWKTEHLPHLDDNILEDSTFSNYYMHEYIEYLTDIAHVCYSKNIRFIAITTPCHQNYISKTCSNGIARLYYIVKEVGKYYPIEYFNYMDDVDFRADSLFLDCSHLNYIGAEHFTKRLKHDLGL